MKDTVEKIRELKSKSAKQKSEAARKELKLQSQIDKLEEKMSCEINECQTEINKIKTETLRLKKREELVIDRLIKSGFQFKKGEVSIYNGVTQEDIQSVLDEHDLEFGAFFAGIAMYDSYEEYRVGYNSSVEGTTYKETDISEEAYKGVIEILEKSFGPISVGCESESDHFDGYCTVTIVVRVGDTEIESTYSKNCREGYSTGINLAVIKKREINIF